VGGLVGFGLSAVLAPAALESYGWRIAFLLGAATLPFGIWVRRGLPETLHLAEERAAPAKARTTMGHVSDSRRIIALALLVLAAGTISTYVANYMTTFAQHTLRMTPGVSFAASAIGSLTGVAAILFGGWLSDRIGRRPVMIWPGMAHLILILPVFFWITSARSPVALICGTSLLALLSGVGGGGFYVAVTESLPKPIRGGAFAIVYALSIAIFGGTTQLVITWLIHLTGNAMAPAWYLAGAATLGMGARLLILESAPVKTLTPAAVPA